MAAKDKMKMTRWWTVALGLSATSCGARTGLEQTPYIAVLPTGTPRPISPLSLGNVTLRRPTLRWELPPLATGALVELCRDRACTMVIESLRVTGTSVRPSTPLPARSVVFWRLRATEGGFTSGTFSPTWLFHVPATDNSGGIDTSSDAHLDLNGDGFDDVVVTSSETAVTERLSTRTASVYHGSTTGIPTTPARIIESVHARDRSGISVANAGDVNGDGVGDLIIGSFSAGLHEPLQVGTASVFHGSPVGIAMTPAIVLRGATFDDSFGRSVASAGDVNRDGFGDLVVGADTASPSARLWAGTASVFHGSAVGASAAPAIVLEGDAVDSAFGGAIASAGDLNGDGFGDLIVGAPRASPGDRLRAGTASVFHGSARGIAFAPVRVLDAPEGSYAFGASVASAGDVNGDGFGDLVVGTAFTGLGERYRAGIASVFHGSAVGLSANPARLLEGVAPDDLFGSSVASAGDVNADGFDDLVVGSRYARPGGRPGAGTASVFYGSAIGIPMAPARVLEGAATGDLFGDSLLNAGDVNGDGFNDLVVRAAFADPGGRRYAGTVSVFHGSMNGLSVIPTVVLEGP